MRCASDEFRDLAGKSKSELEAVLQAGESPSIDALTGFQYRGYNHAPGTALIRSRKFLKGFFSAEGRAFGCNFRVEQNGLADDWVARPDDANPRPFAFYGVVAARDRRDDQQLHDRAALLDYGAGNNATLDPARLLRDYVVRVHRGSDELLLGKAYLAVRQRLLPVGFFLLERHRPYELDAESAARVAPT